MSDKKDGNRTKFENSALDRRKILLGGTTLAATAAVGSTARTQVAQAQQQPAASAGRKPNILVIFGDDIGVPQISAYTMGMMGYRTPNIDRIAREGAIFTDAYGQQSCTAGRASFILGEEPFRTGLLTIGMPGDPHGIQDWMPTIADALKSAGYATGQFGKNHLGDRDEHLPTMHGFDEFFGNLYHLNAEEEPENADYPKGPDFKKKFGPRGVLHCHADGKGGQTIKAIGQAARRDIAEAAETRVHLFLHVKVRENWADDPERYREMGLEFPKGN